MKTILLTLLLATNLFAATAMDKNGAYKLNRFSKLHRDLAVGTMLYGGHWLKGQYSYAVSGGGTGPFTTISLLDDEGTPVKLPSGAIIFDCVIDVLTAPTSTPGGLGTIQLSSKAAGDIKATAAVTAYTTTSPIACTPVGTAAAAVKVASETTLKIHLGSEKLTAGKINVWVNYVISE